MLCSSCDFFRLADSIRLTNFKHLIHETDPLRRTMFEFVKILVISFHGIDGKCRPRVCGLINERIEKNRLRCAAADRVEKLHESKTILGSMWSIEKSANSLIGNACM